MTLSDLAMCSITRSIARSPCNSSASCFLCCVLTLLLAYLLAVITSSHVTNLESLCDVGFMAAKQWKTASIYSVTVTSYVLVISVGRVAESVAARDFDCGCDIRLSLSDV